MFKGISASPGVAIGKALVYKTDALNIIKSSILNIEDELERLQSSIEVSRFQLKEIKAETGKKLGLDAAAILKAHIMILEDQEFTLQIKNKIIEEKVCATYAANETIEAYASIFRAMEDEYMKERAADIRDVGTRLLKNLLVYLSSVSNHLPSAFTSFSILLVRTNPFFSNTFCDSILSGYVPCSCFCFFEFVISKAYFQNNSNSFCCVTISIFILLNSISQLCHLDFIISYLTD